MLDGPREGERISITALPASLGSAPDKDVVLRGMGVAEAHARLVLRQGALFLEDLDAGGMTRVNGSLVRSAKLQNGDIIEVGENRLLLQLDLSAEGAAEQNWAGEAVAVPSVWLVGFPEEVRTWFEELLVHDLGFSGRVFCTGEEVLIALSQALGRNQPPSLIILDLRLPIINGINAALVIRAYELGFRLSEHIPLVFLFDPPESSNFDKIVKFCQPIKVFPCGTHDPENIKHRLSRLISDHPALRH